MLLVFFDKHTMMDKSELCIVRDEFKIKTNNIIYS